MGISFGARLRQQRERQGVTLTTIAAATKIKASLLDELERDNPVHWPTGIFRRSYVRAYASAIGLEPDVVVREFLALYPDPAEEVSPVDALAKTADGSSNRRPPTRLTYLLSSAISALPSLLGPSSPSAAASAPAPHPAGGPAHEFVTDSWEPSSGSPSSGSEQAADAPGTHRQITSDSRGWRGRHETNQARVAEPEPWPTDDMAFVNDGAAAMAPGPFLDNAGDTGLPEFELVPPPLFEPDTEDTRVHAGARVGLRADQGARTAHGDTPMADAIAGRTFDIVAGLCTRLARAHAAEDVSAVLQDATVAVDAVGVILWLRDGTADALRPVLSHGYSDDLLAQVPSLPADSDNAIGGAFRSGEARLVAGTDHATGAIAVPVLSPAGCTGVLAAEFRDGGERRPHMRSMLTILAAQLSMVVAHPGALDDQA